MNSTPEVLRRRAALRRRMLAWYSRHARDLPWRRTRDPYHIWLSEIMLQQTRVETVIPYFNRFVSALPTLEALAEADEQTVLKLWEGLGYYSRARNLQRAARALQQAGRLPRDVAGWLSLPGVGRYTAGAIVSIAFGLPAPLVDGNVKRVLARWFGLRGSVDDRQTAETLWKWAELLVPAGRPGDFNQALMELGATVCLPRSPRCLGCPVEKQCDARRQGAQGEIPVRRTKKRTPHYDVVAAVICRRGRVLIGKRPAGGMLGGLWEFPGGKVEPGETHAQALAREVREETGLLVEAGEPIARIEHAYSHFRITLHVYRSSSVAGRAAARGHDELRWVKTGELEQYAFPAANRKVIRLLLTSQEQ